MGTPHSVYRLFDKEDNLLYIGCTGQPVAQRVLQHQRWGHGGGCLIHRYTSVEYPDKKTARAAEAEAIRAQCPPFNIQHNPRGYSLAWVMKELEEQRRQIVAVRDRAGSPS